MVYIVFRAWVAPGRYHSSSLYGNQRTGLKYSYKLRSIYLFKKEKRDTKNTIKIYGLGGPQDISRKSIARIIVGEYTHTDQHYPYG